MNQHPRKVLLIDNLINQNKPFLIKRHHPYNTPINVPNFYNKCIYLLFYVVNVFIVFIIFSIQFYLCIRIRSRYWNSCFFIVFCYYFSSVISELRYQKIVYSYYMYTLFYLIYFYYLIVWN